MPATLLQKAIFAENAHDNSELLKRITAAAVEVAVTVRAEAEPNPMTALFVARQSWAIAMLAAPSGRARNMMRGLLTVPAIHNNLARDNPPNDNAIQTAVTSLVNIYSTYVPVVT